MTLGSMLIEAMIRFGFTKRQPNIFESDPSGIVDVRRDHVLTGKERHTPAQSDHMGGTPMRAIRNNMFIIQK